ncbi:sodium:solute symporter family protein [Actinocrispum wychmicini]|uniref:SSS family solute:Na+ symporter n=1 Tax=Actinocrispum wychmicini TaxID=1213861 RepID=A0A4R2JX89_9PSEU|nr:sodium:solute symporter family protein [Actinocrispum wychmicini]TCO62008.1 SSS family solute:Na+ symporter [Actinocrispum wychmicini]
MNVTLLVMLVGVVVIGAFGVLGRRRQRELSDWTVGGRQLGGATMWFLQAGETFTIFTFLGLAGLGFTGGVAALYALLYIPLAFVGLYFLGPRLWRRCRDEGHLTQADFVGGFFASPVLGRVVAVLGVVFVLPYLQLQITGLGLAVQLATGDRASADLGMVIAFAITVGFVLWSGIRGVATASYFKDGLMLVVLVVLAVVIPSHFSGGLGSLFTRLVHQHPAILTIHSGPNDTGWYVSSVIASGLGLACMTLPHMWPELLAARSAQALRRNYVWLPAYSLVLVFPVFIGMTAIGLLPTGTDSNSALLLLVSRSLPPWLVGVVVVAAAATAMVPAGGIIIGMSTLISRNILPTTTQRGQYRTTMIAVVGVAGLALVLALLRPDLIANLLLLTYSGLDQLVPAILVALLGRRFVSWRPVLAGMLVGVAAVIVLTPPFGSLHVGHVNAGLLALGPNVLVVAAGALIERRRATQRVTASDANTESAAVHP